MILSSYLSGFSTHFAISNLKLGTYSSTWSAVPNNKTPARVIPSLFFEGSILYNLFFTKNSLIELRLYLLIYIHFELRAKLINILKKKYLCFLLY